MGEKILYTCMCNWVPMLYTEEKKRKCNIIAIIVDVKQHLTVLFLL